MTSQSISTQQNIPDWLIWVQCLAFIVLYAFWNLPEIVGVRNTSMIIGALAGLYPIYVYRNQLIKLKGFPLWLIMSLFIWIIIHYIFFSQDPQAQARELHRIWRYALICSIFGIGFGLSLANKPKKFWPLIYFGMVTPIVIYLVKNLLTQYGQNYGYEIPPYLKIYFSSQPYYIPKVDYTVFCLPALFTAIGFILYQSKKVQVFTKKEKFFSILNYLVVTFSIYVFYIQNIKNAILYTALIILTFYYLQIKIIFTKSYNNRLNLILILFLLTISIIIIYNHINNNDSWGTFIADAKVAIQIEKYDHWKWGGEKGYPINEYGMTVSPTTYERIAWAIEAINLIINNPIGYGLVELSFKMLLKKTYPELINVGPMISHSHSGWLDIFLGLGIVGGGVLIGTALYLIWSYRKQNDYISILLFYTLISLFLIWMTSEVSATVPFMNLIFWTSLASTYRLNIKDYENVNKK